MLPSATSTTSNWLHNPLLQARGCQPAWHHKGYIARLHQVAVAIGSFTRVVFDPNRRVCAPHENEAALVDVNFNMIESWWNQSGNIAAVAKAAFLDTEVRCLRQMSNTTGEVSEKGDLY